MYKRPSSRQIRVKLTILYSFMTLLVIASVTLFMLLVADYQYNTDSGKLEQRGLVQFNTAPRGAKVLVNNNEITGKTPTKKSLVPGSHSFSMTKAGYLPWEITDSVVGGEILWLDYARLVPEKRPIEQIEKYSNVVSSMVSSDRSTTIFLENQHSPTFSVIDITNRNVVKRNVALPSTILSNTATNQRPTKAAYRLVALNVDGSMGVVLETIGKTSSYFLVDFQEPNKSRNLSDEFGFDIKALQFPRSPNDTAYVLSDSGDLSEFRVNGSSELVKILSYVETFQVQRNNDITFQAKLPEQPNHRFVGIIPRDKKPVQLVRVMQERQSTVKVVSSDYLGRQSVALVIGQRLFIYTGGTGQSIEQMNLVVSRNLEKSVQTIEFNPRGDHAVVMFDESYLVYSLHRNLFIGQNRQSPVATSHLSWLDSMHFGFVDNGQLVMRDIDGSNQHEINSATSGLPLVLDPRGEYIYSFGKSLDKTLPIQLQRVKMVL